MRFYFLIVILLLTHPLAAQTCSSETQRRNAAEVADARAILRKAQMSADDLGGEVPAIAQKSIAQLKLALAATAREVVGCEPDATVQTMEAELAKLLIANPPQPPAGSVSNHDPRYQEFLAVGFGRNLLVRVDALSQTLLTVRFSFHIPCGDDNVLMVFAREGARWRERLLWEAKPYSEISGAFGDMFLFKLLDGSGTIPWRLVVVHGTPWCTSRFSGFSIDVTEPSAVPEEPKVLWHTERGYLRFDFQPRLTASGDTFELRLHSDEMSFNEDGFERMVIYRYRVGESGATRLEPVAATGRGFVEEWLSMPWNEAAEQSASGDSSLREIHGLYENRYPKDGDTFASWAAGAVRDCGENRYQVAFDTELEKTVPGKPGGKTSGRATYYFHILHVANGYRMESVASGPEKQCSGPDLMRKASH